MAQLIIEDFKNGLDTRRSAFTAPPGSLRELVNAHITRGGEIEKRRAFALFGDATGTKGLHIAREDVFVFGSDPRPETLPGQINYQRLQAPTEANLTRVLDTETFDGLVYAIAEFDDGNIYHYYNGQRVTEWDTLSEQLGSNAGVAAFLAERVNTITGVSASSADATITITGDESGDAFSYEGFATNGGEVNDQDIEFSVVQEASDNTPAGLTFQVTGGSEGPGNEITQLTVGGTELLASPVPFDTSNSTTAGNLVAAINGNSGHSFSASSDAAVISLTAPEGTGTSFNGVVLSRTLGGDVTLGPVSEPDYEFTGGTAAAVQIIDAEIVGTFEPQDRFVISVKGDTVSTTGLAVGVGTTVKAFGDKLYSTAQSVLYFTGVLGNPFNPDPTWWDANAREAGFADIEPGFINMATQYSGGEILSGLGIYQDQLAVFSRRAVQLWQMDLDFENNTRRQLLLNVGALSNGSIVEYGDQDLFFLSESGIRSLRARDSSNLASARDPGVAIDSELRDYLLTLTDEQINRSEAIVEPIDSRYLLTIGDRVYVYTTFQGSDISSWSRYDLGAPVERWAVSSRQLFCRAGDSILLYGGATGEEYDDQTVIVDMPYLDAGAPMTGKKLQQIGLGAQGLWSLWVYSEPESPQHRDGIGQIDGSTYGSRGKVPVNALSTHFRFRLEHSQAGPALLANMVIQFQPESA